MNLNELWKFISDNADALGVLLTLATIFGGIIGFLLKIIWERVTKSSERKNTTITNLEKTISNQQNEISSLKNELQHYHSVTKSNDGEVLIQIETSTKICPVCWNSSGKAIPVFDDGHGYYKCTICNHKGIFDYAKREADKKQQDDFINQIAAINEQHNNYFNKNGWF